MHFSDALLSGKGAHIFYFKQRLWLILNNDRFVIGLADEVHRRPWLVSAAGCRLAGDIRAVGIEGPLYDGQKRTVGLPVIYWRFRCRRLRGRCYPGNVQLMALVLHKKWFSELTTQELYELLRIRNDVFVVEQDCVYQDLDYDDRRPCISGSRKMTGCCPARGCGKAGFYLR